MSEIRDRIANLNIRVRSADGSVSGRLSMREGISVGFAERVRDRHDEESLSRCVEEVLRGLAVGKRRAGELILHKARQDGPNPETRRSPDRRQTELEDALAQLDMSVESPDGHLSIRQIGSDKYIVVMRRGTVSRIDHVRLAREITATVRKLARVYAVHARVVTTEIYDSARKTQRTTA